MMWATTEKVRAKKRCGIFGELSSNLGREREASKGGASHVADALASLGLGIALAISQSVDQRNE